MREFKILSTGEKICMEDLFAGFYSGINYNIFKNKDTERFNQELAELLQKYEVIKEIKVPTVDNVLERLANTMQVKKSVVPKILRAVNYASEQAFKLLINQAIEKVTTDSREIYWLYKKCLTELLNNEQQ